MRARDYRRFHPRFERLFNSYYESVGPQQAGWTLRDGWMTKISGFACNCSLHADGSGSPFSLPCTADCASV